jgi:hypothetical protein
MEIEKIVAKYFNMPVDLPKAGETKDEYLAYCIPQEIR